MKIAHEHHTRRNIAVIITVLVALAVGILIVLYYQHTHTASTIPGTSTNKVSNTTPAHSTQDLSRKREYVDNAAKQEQQGQQGETVHTPQPSDNISLSAQQAGDSVTVYTQLAPISSGTCTLTVANGAKNTTQTAEVIYQSQHSLCAGFSVPIASVGSGNWSIVLSVTAPSGNAQKTIFYEVK